MYYLSLKFENIVTTVRQPVDDIENKEEYW